jgi:CRP-like cAMP-binding protein
MSSVSAAGKSVTFTGVGPGGWFGEGSLLKGEPRKYDIVALRDTRMAWMPRSTFDWLLGSSIAFNRYLLLQLNERLGQFIGLVEYARCSSPTRASPAAWPKCSTRFFIRAIASSSTSRRRRSATSAAYRDSA